LARFAPVAELPIEILFEHSRFEALNDPVAVYAVGYLLSFPAASSQVAECQPHGLPYGWPEPRADGLRVTPPH